MWLKNTTSMLLTAIFITSASVGFNFSIKEKKIAPFVRIKTSHIENDVKAEAIIAYDFANQIVSASLEREEARIIGGL